MLKFFFFVISCISIGFYWGELISVLLMLSIFMMMMSWEGDRICYGLFSEMDWVSYILVFLSVWLVFISFMSSMKIKLNDLKMGLYGIMIVLLLLFLLCSFLFSDYLMFYLSFECSLIPILIMILGWGYQPERAQAGVYMLFYTISASFPLFFLILKMMNNQGSSYFYSSMSSFWYFLDFFFILAFLVKFPMYSVHLWLPKAHVEAPVAGSMLLAGILLKLGGYGILRILTLLSEKPFWGNIFLISLSLWGAVVLGLSCLRQIDMKALIAYSSVVHMSLCICGLLVMNVWGFEGMMVTMLAHGLCSSGLFCIANMVYERCHSRSLMVSKGFLNFMPIMSLWWFILLSANMAAPPSINLLGEIKLILSVVGWDNFSMIIISLISFFSAGYSLYLFSLSQHGKFIFMKSGFSGGKLVEYFCLMLQWVPLNLLIVSVGLMLYFM